jgi:hypothetical protein
MLIRKRPKSFTRCKNFVDLPESVCTICLQTLVAPNFEALEKAERDHSCQARECDFAFEVAAV